MKFDLFINFNGNCREAAEFYARVFKVELKNLMTYADTPPDAGYTAPEADKDRIMYADITIGGVTLMFMDYPSGAETVIGGNIHPTVSFDDKEEVAGLFNELKIGGEVCEELQETFYSGCYGMVKDKFGVTWQILQS